MINLSQCIIGLFEKKTKWRLISVENNSGTDWMLMARIGIKTGMIYTKKIRVSPLLSTSYYFTGSFRQDAPALIALDELKNLLKEAKTYDS